MRCPTDGSVSELTGSGTSDAMTCSALIATMSKWPINGALGKASVGVRSAVSEDNIDECAQLKPYAGQIHLLDRTSDIQPPYDSGPRK